MLRVLGLGVGVLAIACGKPSEPPPAPEPQVEACTPAANRVNAKEKCRADEHCPCGTACLLGECAATCRADGDCGEGMRCDRFGRCRAAKDVAFIPPLAPQPEGRLAIFPSQLRAIDGVEQSFMLRAEEGAVSTVRVVASSGLSIQCEAGGPFEAECRLGPLTDGEVRTIHVEPHGPLQPGEVRVVQAFTPAGAVSLSYGDESGSLPPRPPPTTNTEGVYVGRARLVEAGMRLQPQNARPEVPEAPGIPADDIAIPVRVELIATRLTGVDVPAFWVVLHDELRMLHPEGKLVGALYEETLDRFDLYLTQHSLMPVSLVTTTSLANRFRAVPARYVFHYTNDAGIQYPSQAHPLLDKAELYQGRMKFDLVAYYDVLDTPQRAPKARWRFELARERDLPEGTTPPLFNKLDAQKPSAHDERHISDLTEHEWAVAEWERSFADPVRTEASLRRQGAHTGGCGGVLRAPGKENQLAALIAARNFVAASPADATNTSGNLYALVPFSLASQPVVASAVGPLFEKIATDVADAANLPNVDRRVSISGEVQAAELFWIQGPAEERDIPCELALSPFSVIRTGGPTLQYANLTVDVCAQAAARYGCDVAAVASTDVRRGLGLYFKNLSNLTVTSGTQSMQWTFSDYLTNGPFVFGLVTRVCRMPAAPPHCAELVQCHSPTQANLTESSLFGSDFATASGDARCLGTARTGGFTADQNPLGLDSGTMVSACLADVARLQAAPDPARTLLDYYSSQGCTEVARVLHGLGTAGDGLRLGLSEASAQRGARHYHRLLQRWVQLLGFIAAEARENEKLARVIARDARTSAPVPSVDALRASLAGLQLLLHPRFAVPLDRIPGAVLASPDYRPDLGGVPLDIPTDASVGLAAELLKTLETQVELAALLVERAQFTRDVTALEHAGSALRSVAVLYPMALELHARAKEACPASCNSAPEPAWDSTYQKHRAGFLNAIDRLLASARALREGGNPLGIDEGDLPLYFLGTDAAPDGRYFAVSDYLLGNGPSSQSWAPSLVVDAAHRLEAARSAWLARQARLVATEEDARQRAIRISDAKRAAGEVVLQYCGRPGALLPGEVLDRWESAHGRPFNPNDCFLDRNTAACLRSEAAYLERVDQAHVRYAACVVRFLDGLYPGSARFADPAWTSLALACAPENLRLDKGRCDQTSGPCLRCDSGAVLPVPSGVFLTPQVNEAVPDHLVREAESLCRTRVPDVVLPLPGPRHAGSDPPASCYRGSIGEQALAMQSIAQEIEIARAEMDELHESYDISMKSCILRKQASDQIAQMQAAHDREMQRLRGVKLALDVAANVAGATKDCADSLAGATAPWDKAFAGAACGAGLASAALSSAALGIEKSMADAEAQHQQKLQSAEAQAEYEVCKNDARQALVGAKSQALRVQQALLDMQAATVAFRNLQAAVQLAWDDGVASVAGEEERTQTPLSGELWLDERVSSYLKAMRLAQRVTYLAVRAVEYEFQQSLAVRGTVLAAEVPSDLENAIRELRTLTGPRNVNGSRPTSKKVVLSLRDDILKLSDQRNLDSAELRLSPAERLRLRLRSPEYAVHDSRGRYLGQQIPFTLGPLGYAGEGALIYSQDSCAERVWSVNASLLGNDLVRGSATTFTNLVVMKANTFTSQWCAPNATELQTASVRPAKNLFRDPTAGSPSFVDTALGRPADLLMSKALIQPSLNVSRAEFEGGGYSAGASSQLAARGLYGEYALFFPAQVISRAGPNGPTDGLDLTRVDDILLRFDYVTAAR